MSGKRCLCCGQHHTRPGRYCDQCNHDGCIGTCDPAYCHETLEYYRGYLIINKADLSWQVCDRNGVELFAASSRIGATSRIDRLLAV